MIHPGAEVLINDGLRDPRHWELSPTTPATVEEVDGEVIYARAASGVLYTVNRKRAASLALLREVASE